MDATTEAPPAVEHTPQQETLELLMELMARLLRHLEAMAAEEDLSLAQAKALRFLGTATPMRDLAGSLHCDASNVTGIIDRLEGRGLVERQTDPGDRRIKNLVLTDEGRTVRRRLEERVFEGLPFEAEQPALLAVLRRILGREA